MVINREISGDVPFVVAANVLVRLAIGSAFVEMASGSRIVSLALDGYDVERVVEFTVPSLVETVARYEP